MIHFKISFKKEHKQPLISREIYTSKICVEYEKHGDHLIVSDHWGTKYMYPANTVKEIILTSDEKS